jgi:Tfp pilus assembly protein PilF
MNRAQYLFDHAVMCMRAGRFVEASDHLAECIRHNPKHAFAWSLRGRLENEAGRPFNALLHYDFAVFHDPTRYDIWSDRGITAAAAGRLELAKEAFKRSLALQESFEGRYNYGNVLLQTMELEKAVEQYNAALKIDPSHAQCHTNLGTALIGIGNWQEGFNHHRHRFGAPGFPPRPQINYPLWRGENLSGKSILLYTEQGLGDEILSLRFAKTLKARGARVAVSVRPLNLRMARSLECADAVILQYDEPPWPIDYMVAALDVPAFTGITPESVPLAGGYLKAEDRGFSLKWPQGLRVGICWASGRRPLQPATDSMAKAKSVSFENLSGLARPGVVLVSLQQYHNSQAALRELGVFDPMPGVQDLMDTAWIIDQLDLVITVDTAVAHLAGALGKPVWNLVRFDGLWPWQREGGRTCWYDRMTIYRQPVPGDWKDPLERMLANFAEKTGENRAAA